LPETHKRHAGAAIYLQGQPPSDSTTSSQLHKIPPLLDAILLVEEHVTGIRCPWGLGISGGTKLDCAWQQVAKVNSKKLQEKKLKINGGDERCLSTLVAEVRELQTNPKAQRTEPELTLSTAFLKFPSRYDLSHPARARKVMPVTYLGALFGNFRSYPGYAL